MSSCSKFEGGLKGLGSAQAVHLKFGPLDRRRWKSSAQAENGSLKTCG